MLINPMDDDNNGYMTRKPFTTRIREDLLSKVNALAAITDRNINELIEEGIEILLDKYDKEELVQQFLSIKKKAASNPSRQE